MPFLMGQARNRNEGEGKEEDGSGDEGEMALSQVFKEQLDGNQRQRGISDAGEFDTTPTSTGKGQRKCDRAEDECAQESDGMGLGSGARAHSDQADHTPDE